MKKLLRKLKKMPVEEKKNYCRKVRRITSHRQNKNMYPSLFCLEFLLTINLESGSFLFFFFSLSEGSYDRKDAEYKKSRLLYNVVTGLPLAFVQNGVVRVYWRT